MELTEIQKKLLAISRPRNKEAIEMAEKRKEKRENERIRKALIDYFDNANKADENPLQNYGIHTDKVIKWLKNQSK